jgi:hypothetical protein
LCDAKEFMVRTPAESKSPLVFLNRASNRLFRVLSSVKLAVVVIVSLTVSMIVATSLESYFDTPTAQFWVYRAIWFHGIQFMLGVNILVVALSRWPWKRRHAPFLLAHLGILMVLFGSWITYKQGLDGSIRLPEGQSSAVVEVDSPQIVVSDQKDVHVVPMKWRPPHLAFRGLDLRDHGLPYDVRVDRYLTHAEPIYSFMANPRGPRPASGSSDAPKPAVQLNISGGPMRISEDVWLWTGDRGWQAFSMGPAWFAIGAEEPKARPGSPGILLTPGPDGSLSWLIRTSDGKSSRGKVAAKDADGKVIETGWKGGVKLTLKRLIPDAVPDVTYRESRTMYGANAPASAIHLVSGTGGQGREVWLGLGDRAILKSDSGEIEVGYMNERVMMPFSLRLERFQIEHNPGTRDPAAYWSRVRVEDGAPQEPVVISMNEPLFHRGLTIYQASYENPPVDPALAAQAESDPEVAERIRPNVSIFAVNRDPGRDLKYWGSLLIVFGSILLFAMKLHANRPKPRPAGG